MKFQRRFLWLSAVFILAAGCATQQGLSRPDRAAVLGVRLADSYFAVHDTYQDLEKALSGERLEQLRSLAPDLDRAKDLLVDYNEAVILWRAAGQVPGGFRKNREALRDLIMHVSQVLSRVASKHIAGD